MGQGALKQMHQTYVAIVADFLHFGDVATLMDIVWQQAVPLNF